MGNPKQKWTSEEEEALRAGVAKHGTGKWKDIQRDPEFNPYLRTRSNIDLKDKWRNMSVSSQGGPRDKSRAIKVKTNRDAVATPLAIGEPTTTTTAAANEANANPTTDDSPKNSRDEKNTSRYNSMIFEALTTLKEPNGLDISTIVSYIQKRHEVPQNFRRLLSSRLRRLVNRGKLEKIQNCFKMKSEKTDTSLATKIPTPKREIHPRELQKTGYYRTSGHPIEEAAAAAAYKLAEAESKSFLAAEAVKEAERISKMAEESEVLLQLANEILEKCNCSRPDSPLFFH